MTTRAVYAGSFDPVTLGHVDIIRRGAAVFDELIVAMGVNPKKRYRFAIEQRTSMLERAVEAIPNVRVMAFQGLLVDLCAREDVGVILRGYRGVADVDVETRYALANRDLTGVETLMLPASPGLSFVSSSLVKEIADNGGDVSGYVAPFVVEALHSTGRSGPISGS